MTINNTTRQKTLKRLRWLKKEELRIYETFNVSRAIGNDLLWFEYFDTKNEKLGEYPMLLIDVADQGTWKLMVNRFLEAIFERVMDLFKEDKKSLFTLLDLPPYATVDDVKRAFRRKAMELHPDRGGNHDAMIALNEAYDVYKQGS